MSVRECDGLRNFSRSQVDLMLELIELGRNDERFGRERTDELLKFKHKLLGFRAMVWGDGKIRLPERNASRHYL